MTGVCLSLVWFFGILGWLGIPAGFASIIGPVLIVALSIDFGMHVFMRFREQREAGAALASAMANSTGSVTVAFLLVAVTASVGFMANVTNPVGFIRAFGLVITLGVLAAAFIFITIIPAAKLLVDSALELRGVDRTNSAFGTTGILRHVLPVGVHLARRAGLVVIVLAVLAGGLGLVAYTELDRQGFQQDFASDDDWQTKLPGPFAWSAHETQYRAQLDYVQDRFQSDDERERTTAFLVRGDGTPTEKLAPIQAGSDRASASEFAFQQGGEVAITSPLTLLVTHSIADPEIAALVAGVREDDSTVAAIVEQLAAENEEFAQAIGHGETAAIDGDVTHVLDAIYDQSPDAAATVMERSNESYDSMRFIVPMDQGLDINDRDDEVHAIATTAEAKGNVTVVPIDFATVSNAGLGAIADSIVWTMLFAFAGVTLVLGGMFRLEYGTAMLGVVTAIPICIVLGLVFGGMFLFDVPLTFITAFLVSITIGLGIDYAIHVADRFAQELEVGNNPLEALETTVRGTGGALLGSALTSAAAFVTLTLHPSAVFYSFGLIVVLALVLSFVVSVILLPSFLLGWAHWRTE